MEESKSFEVDASFLKWRFIHLIIIILSILIGGSLIIMLFVDLILQFLLLFGIIVRNLIYLRLFALIGMCIPLFMFNKWILPFFKLSRIEVKKNRILFIKTNTIREVSFRDIRQVEIIYECDSEKNLNFIRLIKFKTNIDNNSLIIHSKEIVLDSDGLYSTTALRLNLTEMKYKFKQLQKPNTGYSRIYDLQ